QVAPEDVVPPAPEPGSPQSRAMHPGGVPDAGRGNRADVLTADIPAEGTMTARGVARMYSALLGHVDGVRLVSPGRLARMAAVAFTGMDEVMGFRTSWAFGYSPNRPGGVASRPGSAFGMVGMDGSAAYADMVPGVAVAVMRNRFPGGDSSRVPLIAQIVAGELGYLPPRRAGPPRAPSAERTGEYLTEDVDQEVGLLVPEH